MSEKWFRQSAEPGLMETRGRGIFFDEGSTVPALATVGYAPGALFLLTVSPSYNAAWYINNGTFASSNFQLFTPASGVAPVTAITTLTVTALLHAGRTILLSLATGFASTLPAATGTGNKYRFVIGVIPTTSSTYTIVCAGSDVFLGSLALSTPASTWATANIGETFASTAGTTITIGGSSSPKGGATIGDYVEVQDIASAKWQVNGWLTTATTPTTPFS